MNTKYLTTVLSLTSAITLNTVTSVLAEPQVYLEVGGVESLELDQGTLAILEDVGLTLISAESTAEPAPGFSIGSLLLPPSSNPDVRGTTYTFLYDEDTLLYVPLGGTEEFLGSFVFEVDTNQLSGLGNELSIGNFSNTFDETFSFFLTDTLTTGLRIANIVSPNSPNIDLETQTLVLEGLELFLSEEFSDFLVDAGATQSVAGLKFADSRADRSFVLVSTVSTPEPSSSLALMVLTTGGITTCLKRRNNNRRNNN